MGVRVAADGGADERASAETNANGVDALDESSGVAPSKLGSAAPSKPLAPEVAATRVQSAIRGTIARRRAEHVAMELSPLSRRSGVQGTVDPHAFANAPTRDREALDDDAHELVFSQPVWAREFCYNIFWPASLPFCMWVEGVAGAQLREFWPRYTRLPSEAGKSAAYFAAEQAAIVIFSNMSNVVVAYLIVVHYVLGLTPGLGEIEVAGALANFLLHRSVVGTKYALLSTPELRELRSQDHGVHVREELQLLGWVAQRPRTLYLHFCKAELRLQKNCHAVEFVLAGAGVVLPQGLPLLELDEQRRSARLARRRSSAGADGLRKERVGGVVRSRISVMTAALAMADCSNSIGGFRSSANAACGVGMPLALTSALIPGLYRVFTGGSFVGSNAHEAAGSICALITTLFFTTVTIAFLHIAALDFGRRNWQLRALSQMIAEVTDLGLPWLGGLRISLSDPANTAALVQLLRLLMENGRQFAMRQASFALFFAIVLVLRFGYVIFTLVAAAFFELPADPSGRLVTSIEVAAFFLFFDAVLVSVGRCNASCRGLQEALLLAKLQLHDTRGRSAKLDPARVASATEALTLAHETIGHMHATRPFIFCGMTSTTPLLRLAMSAAAFTLSLLAGSAGYSAI